MPLCALVVREYFGERVLGTAYGAVFFISCIGMGWARRASARRGGGNSLTVRRFGFKICPA